MIKNYITETYLKGFIPELNQYLFTGESDWSKQKEKAEQTVLQDLINKGYKVRNLRPELELDTTTEEEDIASRIRVVVNLTTVTATAALTVTGSNDEDGTYETAGSATIDIGDTSETFLLSSVYRFYKYTAFTGGTVDTVNLVETIYDLFYAYKWLQLILENSTVQEGDKYDVQAKLFKAKYDELWNDAKFFYDKDDSGDLVESEGANSNIQTIIH